MKLTIPILLAMLLLMPFVLNALLPTCYYTYTQVADLLQGYQQSHSDIAKVYIIGYSQQDHVPIYALRISDNVNIDEEEPALMFVGQMHAEEVLGVQITMENIREILTHSEQYPYRNWIEQLDLWFIPTANPEGHNVVSSNMDISYRKNKRDNNLDGLFNFTPSTGYDIDGVDNNRNFGFNWAHGDSLMQPGGLEVYDYYRGPYPMSESENQAIKDLADQRQFVYAVCWHSSRTGNFSEKVYHPFNWKEQRPSPDLTFAASIGAGVASQIVKENGTGTYESFPNLSRKGAFHDWIYQQYGTIALLIECGTSNIQPDSTLMVNTVQRCSNGVRWLINRALLYSTAVPSSAMIYGKVTEAGTNTPLEAEVIIQQHNAPWFEPRCTNPVTGRYYRPLATGSYTVQARKKGYFDTILYNVNVNNYAWTPVNITLQPKPVATLNALVRSGTQAIAAQVIIGDVYPDTLQVNGNFVYNGCAGEYPVRIVAEGYFPCVGSLTLSEGANFTEFSLSPATIIFSQDWETGTTGWEIEGPWVRENELSASGYALTDSWGGNGFYDLNCNVWIKTANTIYIPASENVFLMFDSHLYTEWDYDPARVEVSTNGEVWQIIWQKSGRWDSWRKELVSLNEFAGQDIFLRFRLNDVSSSVELTDPGWTIDNITVLRGMSTANEDAVSPAIPQSALYPNFPNPFNPVTNISFSMGKAAPASLKIYNLKGQLVRTLISGLTAKGDHRISWNGCDDKGGAVGSGVYLYRLETEDYTRSLKMVLMK